MKLGRVVGTGRTTAERDGEMKLYGFDRIGSQAFPKRSPFPHVIAGRPEDNLLSARNKVEYPE